MIRQKVWIYYGIRTHIKIYIPNIDEFASEKLYLATVLCPYEGKAEMATTFTFQENVSLD